MAYFKARATGMVIHVPIQSSQTYTYNGSEQTYVFDSIDSEHILVTDNKQTGAGTYTVTCSLKDALYRWPDNTKADKTFTWVIEKAPVDIPVAGSTTYTYNGTAQTYTFSSIDTDHVAVANNTKTNAGTYIVTCSLSDSNNYMWSDSTTTAKSYSWTIGKATLAVPTVTDTSLTYNGSAQGPTITGFDSTLMSVTGTEYTDAGDYTVSFTLIDSDNYQWDSATTSFSWSIAKAQGTLSISPSSVTLNEDVTTVTLTATITGDGTVTYGGYNTAILTMEDNVITAKELGGTTTITATLSETSNYLGTTVSIGVTATYPVIYGISWDGSSSPVWTRTDSAAEFDSPNPYYANMTDTPSSPFDNILPWSGMVRVTDSEAGELVAIPKYYYKWTKSGDAMTLQVSSENFKGSYVSPAHADRGDGTGERDIVYVGRYDCASNYTSKTGVKPVVNGTTATYRSNIHALGSTIWQYDYAMYWTICMLYLVEFANWNSQAMLGYGCSTSGSAVETMGSTDSMPYHTGTPAATRTTYGHVQYRYIEDPWGNVYERIDGAYMKNYQLYCIKNPADFADNSGGTVIGTPYSWANGTIAGYAVPSIEGFEYALYPAIVYSSGSFSTYICDFYGYPPNSSITAVFCGQHWSQMQEGGLFRTNLNAMQDTGYTGGGCRLMKLP